MAIQLLKQESDYLHPGSPNDARLFHSDSSDQVQVWSPQIGQGYIQTIPLREGLSLNIIDYVIHNTPILRYIPERNQFLEFEFRIAGPASGQSAVYPQIGWKMLGVWTTQQRQFKVEVGFSPPNFAPYSHKVIEHLFPQDQTLLYNLADWIHCHQHGCSAPSPQAAFNQILSGSIPSRQLLASTWPFASSEILAFGRLWRPMTLEMHQVVDQILSCPYGGRVRRTYLERKALELVALKLKVLAQLRSLSYPLNTGDIDGIYQAAKILAQYLNNPPSVEALARQVGLNRLKLNEGFHHIYGIPPFQYLRNCRLQKAQQLLFNSELTVGEIAYRVGYNSLSSFSSAFRQKFGLNPKTLQIQSRNRLRSQISAG
ncbi:MAG: AraC family transcriptional regulator [Cyanobacteria bacterium P01_H01_bin.21]